MIMRECSVIVGQEPPDVLFLYYKIRLFLFLSRRKDEKN